LQVHLVNPSNLSFGVGVITPRWLYVLAAATPREYGDPLIVDEALEQFDPEKIQPGDIVGIGIHTANALRGYDIGKTARERGAKVVFGGVHASLYPDEAQKLGAAHAVVKGDGDIIWAQVLADHQSGNILPIYEGGRIEGSDFAKARWDLLESSKYMWASVQTVRGCPKHCSFCSVWRTDGQKPRQSNVDGIIQEIRELRSKGFRFVALADDNFYPVTLRDLEVAKRGGNQENIENLQSIRDERFELMARLETDVPKDMIFFTQITMEAAEDTKFLDAMCKAKIRGALVGIESVTPEGLKAIYKGFNLTGEGLVDRLRTFREHGVFILGSFIFGLPTDNPETFDATAKLAGRAELAFAQFMSLSVFPGTVDFQKWEKRVGDSEEPLQGFPSTRYWLQENRLRKADVDHPTMSKEEILMRTQEVWNEFYSIPNIWKRSRVTTKLRWRISFLLVSKLYRQMYANTGLSTDSARVNRAATWARLIAKPCTRLFKGAPMPELQADQG
jgi:radical SAM superfamily enzyme YgiQ (UPF0313 family)